MLEKKRALCREIIDCNYCGFPVINGCFDEETKSVYHSDCFSIYQDEKSSWFKFFNDSLKVQRTNTCVKASKSFLEDLINQAVDDFPIQGSYFIKMSSDELNGFYKFPFFKYELFGSGFFSTWNLRQDFEIIAKQVREAFSGMNVVGFAHTHDTKGMSFSDFIYPAFCYKMLPNFLNQLLELQMQVDVFYPVFKQMVKINHELNQGFKPLADFKGNYLAPSLEFKNHVHNNSGLLESAKRNAKRLILAKPEDYIGVYSNPIQTFKGLAKDEVTNMTLEISRLSRKKNFSPIEIEETRILKHCKGRIEQYVLNL